MLDAIGRRLGSRPVGYVDWHDQPGYFRDVTRHLRADAKVLDIGCGSGWLAEHRALHRVDSMPEAVAAAARVETATSSRPTSTNHCRSTTRPSRVILKDVLEHVRDPVSVVREVLDLQPGGRVFASSPDAQRWAWDDYTHRRPFTRKSSACSSPTRGSRSSRSATNP